MYNFNWQKERKDKFISKSDSRSLALDKYYEEWNLTKKQKTSSVNAVMAQFKPILNDVVREESIPKSPAFGIKFLMDVDKTAAETYHRALPEEE